MKLYKCIYQENKKIIKVSGLTILEQTKNASGNERVQKLFGGLITTVKTTGENCCTSKKEIKFLGKTILKRLEEKSTFTYYMFNKKIAKNSCVDAFKKRYIKCFDKQYDDIYLLCANSGEIYLTLAYILKSFIKKNNSKNPLLVATRPYHVDIINMFCPEIPHILINKLKIKVKEKTFKINNFRFFLLFDTVHFREVENDINNDSKGEQYYFKSILRKLDIANDEISLVKANVPAADEQNMLDKVSKTGLNLDKFVFLAPEANSCMLYDNDFWRRLIDILHTKGYDVFVNLTSDKVNLAGIIGYKTCFLTYAEVFALASRAKKIISLRSGLSEFLLQTNVPMVLLYTKFDQLNVGGEMDAYHVLSGFSVEKIPFVDKSIIRELNTFELSPMNCLDISMQGL